jgi:hypothetical protein
MNQPWTSSFNNTTISRNAKVVTFQPNSKQLAKADAIMYSIDRAAFSIQRNPSLSFSRASMFGEN